jgi:hypothetical protein
MKDRTRRPSPAVQKKAPSNSVSQAPPIVHDVLRSAGQPLDAATRAFMEPRFGQDFSHVRVHTDERAAASASAVSAVAYTVGQDLVFASGKYAPQDTQGQQLLAHELTHVVQQAYDAHGASSSPSAAEAEADRIGAHIAGPSAPAQAQASTLRYGSRAGMRVGVRTGQPVLQRQGDKNPLDEAAKRIIAAAKDDKVALAARAVALVKAILDTYYAGEKAKVDGVEYDDAKAGTGLLTSSVGTGATAKGKIYVGDYFTQNVDAFARRVLQVGHELMHIDQYRGGMAGGQNKDKREFLAFHANALAAEKTGTGRMSFATRLQLIDTALGYYYCLSAEDQTAFEPKKAELQTKRKEVDGKAGNDPVPEPTACKRQG